MAAVQQSPVRPSSPGTCRVRLQLFTKSIFSKLVAMAILALPLVAVSGFAYSLATGKGLRESMFRTYAVLQDTPGARGRAT